MKSNASRAVAIVLGAALVGAFQPSPAGAIDGQLTALGYESIFDDWNELALPSITVRGEGVMPTIDAESQRLYQNVALTLKQPTSRFVRATWSGNGFNELAQFVAKNYPEIYVSASRANPDVTASRYDLVFTELPPESVVAKLRKLPVDVDVRYGAPASHQQLLALRQNIVESFRSQALVAVDFSPLGSSLQIRYQVFDINAEAAVRQQLETAVEQFFDGILESDLRPRVDYEADPTLGSDQLFQELMAGYPYSGCTSGFAATLNGTQGLLTAKHCDDPPYYNGISIKMGPTVNASTQIDIQFNAAQSPHTVVRRFKNRQLRHH